MIRQEDVIKIGQFAKPHGVKGEIALVTQSDVLDESGSPYIICEIEGILVPFFIEEYRYKSDSVILLKLEDINDEIAASEFTGRDVYYPLDEMNGDDVGDVTWDNFIGYLVTDEVVGELGMITDVDESTLNVLIKIDHQGVELLIPAVEELIIAIDSEKKQMKVSLPEGLLDLYKS